MRGLLGAAIASASPAVALPESATALPPIRLQTGALALTVDGQGRLSGVSLGRPPREVLHDHEPSHLLRVTASQDGRDPIGRFNFYTFQPVENVKKGSP